ncbi:Uncharacterized protein OS=Sorangium cellulosum (strain So ce56) GN=sce5710 PE=4 SV=1 [Gemmata massiliana]|uniref:Uncharacterized protein n=1 Tax=Gemmata massiliana TaxID=1210884 RepID=A0A6P2D1N9_9BACT|nr:hypothetical protein [Gemmata massiliana]VTR93300.1 Uncharacterized protein OS=Sorangium cellulosum (strain So ce56) GN=sce5710 PE=4 SV=1 [Gemmata massiliana]
MTEAEWLGQAQPRVMLAFVCPRTSDRKLRLFGCAEFRLQLRPPEDICDEYGYGILRVTERYADGQITADELAQANERVRGDERDFYPSIAWFVSSDDVFLRGAAPRYLGRNSDIIRCVFGNPFRSITFLPDWRTSTAVTLAAQMYESRDFGAMPILGDALQDAGCDNEDVLNHCREPGVHVRGCWVADLVLGKE